MYGREFHLVLTACQYQRVFSAHAEVVPRPLAEPP